MGHSDYAPNLFLVAHDSFTGRMEVSRELVLCGLVAAELAHLVVERRLGVADDRVVFVETPGSVRRPRADPRTGRRARSTTTSCPASSSSSPPHRAGLGESLGEVVYGLVADEPGHAGHGAPGAPPGDRPAQR